MSLPSPHDAGAGLLDHLVNGPAVRLPTWESPSVLQTVIGRESPVSADLEEFRGIPYGTVTARWEQSHLRRRLPRDVFDATRNGPKCVQPSEPNDSRTYQSYLPFPDDGESELDCLNLFVIRPSPAALQRHGFPPYAPIPVLVWIHGGALAFGAGTDPIWDPSRLVLRSLQNGTPIIAVCINYRLNIFGFAASSDILAAQDPTTTGGLNFGLRDQKVALEWVAHNIAAFGGDPERISLGGQSAGAVSTHVHLREATCAAASPFRRAPLFRRVLLHSGALGTLGPVSLASCEPGWQQLYEALFGTGSYQAASAQERVARLRQVPASFLLQAAKTIHNDVFNAVSDGVTASELPFSLDAASDLAVDLGPVDLRNMPARPPQNGIDVLIGVTDLEASIFLPQGYTWDKIQSKFEAACNDATLRAHLLHSYGLTASATSDELQQGLMMLMSDAMFEVPVHTAGKALRAQKQPQYNGHAGAVGQVQAFHVKTGNPFPGLCEGVAHHCVELIYLFDAFHTALVEMDQGITRPYTDPTEAKEMAQNVLEVTGTITPPHSQDENVVAATGAVDSEKICHTTTCKRTNVELSHAIQDFWLNFIVTDDWAAPGGPDSVLVYGKDRGSELESMADDPAWQQRRQRWERLAENPETMFRLYEAIRRG